MVSRTKFSPDKLLSPAEVAAIFGVATTTVTTWAKTGELAAFRTLGGQRRYKADDVERLLEGSRQHPR